jgi:thioredoxin 1
MPSVDKLADKYCKNLKLVKVNASENRRLCLKLKVTGLPTFLLYKDGKEISRLSGGGINIMEIENAVKRIIV